jgi:hypothetical protein
METILQGLLELQGVSAAMVLDPGGRVMGHRGRAMHDRALCEQVSGNLVKAIETVQLQQEDWESIGAQFSDGRLLLRNLGGGAAQGHVLAVIADVTLNPSFATVALRVAANKLRRVLAGAPAGSSAASSVAAAVPAAGSQPLPSDSKVLSSTGLTWSKAASSSAAVSRVTAADPASMAFLTRCAKELARHVGPISKVFVQEAVQRVSPEAPFSLAMAAALLDDLTGQIEDPEDRLQFRAALAKR